jgi:hypothetical protein
VCEEAELGEITGEGTLAITVSGDRRVVLRSGALSYGSVREHRVENGAGLEDYRRSRQSTGGLLGWHGPVTDKTCGLRGASTSGTRTLEALYAPRPSDGQGSLGDGLCYVFWLADRGESEASFEVGSQRFLKNL